MLSPRMAIELARLIDSFMVFPIGLNGRMTTLTGGSSAYYRHPGQTATSLECFDLIEALDLNFAEGNILKALWRRAVARMGGGKPGTTSLYDAEKLVFMSERELARAPQRYSNGLRWTPTKSQSVGRVGRSHPR
jgi:hypothetical protein